MNKQTDVDMSTVISRNDTILASDIGGEVVMMNVNTGNYHILEGVGVRVWSLLEEPAPLASVVETLQTEYEVDAKTCSDETTSFVRDMLACDVIRVA